MDATRPRSDLGRRGGGAVIAGSAYNSGYYGTTASRVTPTHGLRIWLARLRPYAYEPAPVYGYGYAPGYRQQPLWIRQLLAGSAPDEQLLDQLAALAEDGSVKRSRSSERLLLKTRGSKPRQPIERTLQDKCCGVLIDDGGPFLAANVGGDQIAFDSRS